MSAEPNKSNEIKPSDIVFECPYCNKSLAIDCQAAGLTIPCSDCGRIVDVPIPEGMDLSDLDSSVEELRLNAIHLRETLSLSHARVFELEQQVDELTQQREQQAAREVELQHALERLAREVEIAGKAVQDVAEALTVMHKTIVKIAADRRR